MSHTHNELTQAGCQACAAGFSDPTSSAQVIDTYLPGAVRDGKVTTINFSSVAHSDGCHADLVIYLPAKTYFCTDLYFVEVSHRGLFVWDLLACT